MSDNKSNERDSHGMFGANKAEMFAEMSLRSIVDQMSMRKPGGEKHTHLLNSYNLALARAHAMRMYTHLQPLDPANPALPNELLSDC